MRTVKDRPQETADKETAVEIYEAVKMGENVAGDKEIAERAERVVSDCLAAVEQDHRERRTRWAKMDKLSRLWSLSPQAEDFDVHLGGPFKIGEIFAGKMTAASFGTHGYISASPLNLKDNEEKALLMASLIEQQCNLEYMLPKRAPAHFRNVFVFGNAVKKLCLNEETVYTYDQEKTDVELLDGTVEYKFEEPEEKELVELKYKMVNVPLWDFRTEPTAETIEDAGWCGDYSYPTIDDLRDGVDAGSYSSEAVEEFVREIDVYNQRIGSGATARGRTVPLPNFFGVEFERRRDLKGPHITQVAMFEWWGKFRTGKTGPYKPYVITVVFPAHENQPFMAVGGAMRGKAIQIRRNPFFGQFKPYVNHPLIKRENEFYSMSGMEICGRMSHLEDTLATLAIMAGHMEAAPPLAIGYSAGADTESLTGFLPGKKIYAEDITQMAYLKFPDVSGQAIQGAQFWENKGADVAGFPSPQNAPRSPAAGVLADVQEIDQRLDLYLHAFENEFLVDLATKTYKLDGQFMTEERKVKLMGGKGLRATDIRTVRPTDLALSVQFEGTASRRLTERAFQVQGLTNLLDRGIAINMAFQAQGRGEVVDIPEAMRRLYGDHMGVRDLNHLILDTSNPDNIQSAAQEHYEFSIGNRPGIQRGENTVAHLTEHILFAKSGGLAGWREEDRRAFSDHVYDTVDAFRRQVEAAMPNVQQMIQGMWQEALGVGLEPTQRQAPTSGGQRPMQGYAAAGTQQQGSPMFRGGGGGPRPTQGATMGMSPNLGAA